MLVEVLTQGLTRRKEGKKTVWGEGTEGAAAVELGVGGSRSERKAQLVRRGCPNTGALKLPVIPCYAQCELWTTSNSIIWKLVTNVVIDLTLDLRIQNLHLNKISR